MKNIRKTKSFAYKVIYVENGLIVLFEKLRHFTKEKIKVKVIDSDLIIELGNNVMILTEPMINHMIKTNMLFLYECPFNLYEAKKQALAFKVDPGLTARIQGAWEVLCTPRDNN